MPEMNIRSVRRKRRCPDCGAPIKVLSETADCVRFELACACSQMYGQTMRFSGFAVIATDCLLIETIQQFYEGKAETPRGKSEQYFRKFLTQTVFWSVL